MPDVEECDKCTDIDITTDENDENNEESNNIVIVIVTITTMNEKYCK